MGLALVKGSANVTINIFIKDSTVTTGAGLTGLVYNSAGLVCYYVRPGIAATALSLVTQTITGAHSDGGFVEIDATNMPGWYRLDLSDAILATGVDSVGVHLKGATNMAPIPIEIQLTDFDLNISMAQLIDLFWDEVLSGATHNVTNSGARRLRDLQENLGYQLGAIWIDTVNGTSGTENFVNGTVGNPVDNMADANTLAASLNIPRFVVSVGSSITLAATQNNQTFIGHNWTLALGGQDISNSHFFGPTVSGIGIGASQVDFHDCVMGICTLNQFHMTGCGYEGTITFGLAGDYIIHNGHSDIAGSSTPVFDLGAAIGNVNFAMPGWHNGVEIQNLNNTGTDLFSISGIGQIIYAASCSGAVNQRGDWKVTNTGGVTITSDDNTTNIDTLETAHQAGNLGADIDKINGVTITGDGNASPFDVV